MKKHFLMLTTAASILACGTAGASAQEDTDNPVMQQLEQAQQDPTDEVNPIPAAAAQLPLPQWSSAPSSRSGDRRIKCRRELVISPSPLACSRR